MQDLVWEVMCKLVNIMVGGGVPAAVSPYFCGARLHAGNKKDGGISPIAIGNTLRRLASKCCSYGLSTKA